jgi:ABC-type multidrug transport system fused ATPase/permease subunit
MESSPALESTATARQERLPDVNPKGAKTSELREMLEVLRPWRTAFCIAVGAQVISMMFGLAFPYLMGHLVDAAVPSIKQLGPQSWKPTIDQVALIIIGTLIAQAVLTFFYSTTFQTVGQRAVTALRQRLYGKIMSLPMRFFGERRVGELTSRLGNDMATLEDFYCSAIPQAVRQLMLLFGGLIAIFLTSPRLAGLMLASFPVFIALAVLFGRSVRKIWKQAQDRLAEASTVAEETLQGIASVKAFGNEAFERQRYGAAMDSFLAVVLRGARYRAALISFIILAIFGAIVLVLWYGARLMNSGDLTHGELTKFTLYTLFIGGGVSSIAEVISAIQKSTGASQRVRELLAEQGEPAAVAGSRAHLSAVNVAFEDVHFSYPARADVAVLRGVSLQARPGERIALVGPSGAGKSTIVSLLMRFYDADQGRITLDGQDLRSRDLAAVRGRMAIVPQEVLLFGGTIHDNIAYGRPNATAEEVKEAARLANCAEFIERFPDGYQTLVGERGVKLSGGQRQRIAIARAFLRNPDLLLLDEATSALDSEGEVLVQQALDTLLAGRTAIIIAHRLSTVRKCDRIYVLQDGVIAESGSHDELMQHPDGAYRRLAELQFAG